MTGARLTGLLLRELHRREKKLGIVSMCIGKGMGAPGCSKPASDKALSDKSE